MDILVSSNLERLIYELFRRDDEKVRKLYSDLKVKGKFEINLNEVDISKFEAGWADEEDTKNAIATFFDLDDYIMDTHTAVAASVYNDYSCETVDETTAIIVSTANPYKFPVDVLCAIGGREKDPYKAIMKLFSLTALDCPESIYELQGAKEIHKRVIDRSETKKVVLEVADEMSRE